MPIRVYDYQHDITNLEVHPEIRARFLRMEPGPAGGLHSHDLGGEIFLVLDFGTLDTPPPHRPCHNQSGPVPWSRTSRWRPP